MGELLLCSQDMASMPYYIESVSLNVYSLEELSYYMMQDTDLIEPEFMDEELCTWIGAELKMPLLAKELRQMIAGGMSLPQFAGAILEACGYCPPEEIETIRRKLRIYEDKSEIECRKIRADRFLKKKRYAVSMLEYQKLLAEAEQEDDNTVFAGNVWHNLGTAYAGLFLFEEAADCYEQAFCHNQNQASLTQKQAALKLLEEQQCGKAAGHQEQTVSNQAAGDLTAGDLTEADTILRRWKEEYRAGGKI